MLSKLTLAIKLRTRVVVCKKYFWTIPLISYPFSSINIVTVFLKLLFQDFGNFNVYCSFFHVPFCMSVLIFFLQQTSARNYILLALLRRNTITRIQYKNEVLICKNKSILIKILFLYVQYLFKCILVLL